jgi:hypothetical protein
LDSRGSNRDLMELLWLKENLELSCVDLGQRVVNLRQNVVHLIIHNFTRQFVVFKFINI